MHAYIIGANCPSDQQVRIATRFKELETQLNLFKLVQSGEAYAYGVGGTAWS